MKTSIYIPVDFTTVSKLVDIVTMYNNGTVTPDEIIINAFGIEDETSLTTLRKIQDLGHTNVTIYARKTDGDDADNRNYAYQLTSGDIVLFHNPDAYPSTKRVELVKNYFESNDVYTLTHIVYHYDIFADGKMKISNLRVISSGELYKRYFPFHHRESVWLYTKHYGQELGARGVDDKSICVLREVLKEVKWKRRYECELYRGNDYCCGYEFCLDTLYKYKKSSILNIPLTIVN